MVICTRCGRQAAEGETFCRGCGAFLEWSGTLAPAPEPPAPVPPAAPMRRVEDESAVSGRPVVARVASASVHVEPGGRATVTVEVMNRGRTVDQLKLEVTGPAAAWSSVEPARLNLMPGTSAVATITFHPPRLPTTAPGQSPADITVRSHEHPEVSEAERVMVDVAPFVELETTLGPRVLRGTGATATRLLASNRGNASVDLRLTGEDPEMFFAFGFTPAALRVEPGATRDVLVVVKPREPLQAGLERTRPFRVLVGLGDGSRRALDATFVQTPLPPPPPPPEPTPTGPPLSTSLAASMVRVEPGREAGIAVEVVNRRRTADRAALEIRGPAASWATIEPARHDLAPGASGESLVRFHPPRASGTRPGRYEADILVVSREHPDARIAERVAVEVLPFAALEASLAPSVLRGPREGRARLRVANVGNAPVEAVLSGEDPELALEYRFSPVKIRLNPGATSEASVAIKARRHNRSRADLPRPFRVLVASRDGTRHTAEGTFVQEAPRAKRGGSWAFGLMVLLGIAGLVVLANLPPVYPPPSNGGGPGEPPAEVNPEPPLVAEPAEEGNPEPPPVAEPAQLTAFSNPDGATVEVGIQAVNGVVTPGTGRVVGVTPIVGLELFDSDVSYGGTFTNLYVEVRRDGYVPSLQIIGLGDTGLQPGKTYEINVTLNAP